MSLQSQVSGRLAQLRAAGQLLVAPRPWPGRSAGGPRARGSACGPPVALGAHSHCAWPSAGVGAWGASGRGAWVRTWAPLAMAAKVDLSTSTDWKEAKSFLKGLSDKQREEHYFCRDFIKLKKIPTWKETAKGVSVKVEDPKYKKDKQLNEKISLFRGDITKLEVDAIVNAARERLLPGNCSPASKGSLVKCRMQTRPTPTWTQLKNLTRQATEIAQQRFPSPTPEIIFLAILSILAVQAPAVQTEAYWAYVPRPPLLHPVGWFDPEGYKVLTNNSEMIGGFQDSDERPSSSHHVTFEGRADSLPVCLALQGTAPKGCLTLSYRTFLTDSPDKVNQPGKAGNSRWIWETQILSLGFPTYNETFEKVSFMPLPSCIKKYRDINQFWDSSISPLPTWLKCGFSNSASKFFPRGTSLQIWDFSASSGDKQYNKYLKNNADKFHKYSPKDSSGKQITRWFSPGYVEPVWVARDTSRQTMKQHPGLFRLAAASSMILQKRPNETKPTPYALRACVSYPFAMLLGKPVHVNITKLNSTSYMIKCHSCVLTNCISPKERNGLEILLLVKRPAFVMMPVDLKDSPWYDDSALQVLKNLHALIRPKRFVTALILGITALISIITTFAIATTALVQEIHTAHFVNDLNKNISFALSEQVVIDKKLEAKINVLEEVVLALGQDIVNIRRQLETNCHKEFKSICVTPLPYNTSEPWEKIKNHLQGVWKDTDITHDLMALQKDISAMSQAHLKMGSLETLARDLEADMRALSPVDWLQYIIFIAVLGLLVFLVILLFPCIFRLLSRSISQVQKDIYAFRLKNKKPGTATPTTVSPV